MSSAAVTMLLMSRSWTFFVCIMQVLWYMVMRLYCICIYLFLSLISFITNFSL
jgi:hypothetical protein